MGAALEWGRLGSGPRWLAPWVTRIAASRKPEKTPWQASERVTAQMPPREGFGVGAPGGVSRAGNYLSYYSAPSNERTIKCTHTHTHGRTVRCRESLHAYLVVVRSWVMEGSNFAKCVLANSCVFKALCLPISRKERRHDSSGLTETSTWSQPGRWPGI